MKRPTRIRRILAKNVRRLRKAKGLSQSALATDANQHQALISRIENAQMNLKVDTIGKIAAALGVYPRDLFEE
jgi:transcriptional regulator with XRE-family HTH domain